MFGVPITRVVNIENITIDEIFKATKEKMDGHVKKLINRSSSLSILFSIEEYQQKWTLCFVIRYLADS